MNEKISNSVYCIPDTSCTGCMMCGDVCPKKAISFIMRDGFWFPKIDENLCINCGLCSRKCPGMHEASKYQGPVSCYGAKSKIENIRWHSTSGGFFSELAFSFIQDGGYCVGAKYTTNNEIIHSVENDMMGIELLRQSKYAQSKTAGIYSQVKSLLRDNKKVLFCGTACQVEALKSFLGKDYGCLLTMDFVCLGICSPLVYRKYLDMMESKYKSKITRVWFKNKFAGWRNIGVRLDFANKKTYFRIGNRDLFMIAFVGDSIAMRKCCETCKFRKIPHNSDFTVADFWGIENVNPNIDDNKGLSAVFVNTTKGQNWFDRISDKLDYFKTSQQEIIQGNFSTISSKASGKNRDAFLHDINTMSFAEAYRRNGNSYVGLKKLKVDIAYYKGLVKAYIRKFIKI